MANFCDFCPCGDCKNGTHRISHAKTADGKWICDICYMYDICTSGKDRNPNGPCDDLNCRHRPRLVTPWSERGKW